MTNDLAALSEAATAHWQIRLVFGEGDDACRATCQWAGLWEGAMRVWLAATGQAGIDHATADQLATDYLRTRIQAAFVPVETYHRDTANRDTVANEALARAEAAEAVSDDVHKALWAAEARIKVLEEALDGVMIGGNHLALLIGADHPAYGTDHYAALEHYGAGDQYEAWCAWNAIMLARQTLGGEHER